MRVGIGDYVRTKRGLIGKIVNISTFREPCMKYGIEASYLNDTWYIGDDDIKLVKEKPIDLIEEGDYVNGKEVFTLINDQEPKLVATEDGCLNNNDIKTIITKEKLSSVEYRIGE